MLPMRRNGQIAAAVVWMGLAAACGEVGTLESGGVTAADAAADSAALASDGKVADAADASLQADVAADAPGATDAATAGTDALVEDLATPDATEADSASTDAAAADVSATDAATADATTVDTIDAGQADPCLAPRAAFDAARTKALACASPFACYGKALASPDCTCQTYANGTNEPALTALSVAAGDVKKAKCTKACAADCANLSATIGQCIAGSCETTSPSCAELDALFQQALEAGTVCQADADCTFKASNTLACGCAAFVNTSKMGPGTPLFSFATMLVGAYKAKGCTAEVSCECPPAEKGKCVSGKCVVAQ